jgi:hypothetical protein
MTDRTATTRSLPYCRPRSVHSFCKGGYRNTTFTMAAEGSDGLLCAVSPVVLQLPRPVSVPWELGAIPVRCSDRRSVSLEPAVQSRTKILQKSALKIYLMVIAAKSWPAAYASEGGQGTYWTDLPPIELWNRSRGQSRGEGINRLRCRSVSLAHGNVLCIAKELGAVSKPALEHFVVVNLLVNFQEKNRSGGSRGFAS